MAGAHVVAHHGPEAAEQAGYVEELGHNLTLFASSAGSINAIERADLLAGPMLPADMSANPEAYHASNVAAVHAYTDAVLDALEEDHARGGNPVFAWEAFHRAHCLGQAVPTWVTRYLANSAATLMRLVDGAEGRGQGDEAERVGKALGFGRSGPGRGGWLEGASMLKRDREIHAAVKERLAVRGQVTASYDDIVAKRPLSRATVRRAYLRVYKLTKID